MDEEPPPPCAWDGPTKKMSVQDSDDLYNFAKQQTRQLMRQQSGSECPVCPSCSALTHDEFEVAAGIHNAMFPNCECESSCGGHRRHHGFGHGLGPDMWQFTRGEYTPGGVAVGTAVSTNFSSDRSSYTLYRLKRDGSRNECDYMVYLDEENKLQPYIIEKQPCDDAPVNILGGTYEVQKSDEPRYNPYGPNHFR